MKFTKRLIIMLLVCAMLLGMVPATVFAEETETSASVDSGDITVEGTNGVGTLLSEEISEYQEEAAAETVGGYNVIGLEVEDGVATATFCTMETATLVVALYTEDGMQLLVSGNAQVEPEDTSMQITLEGDLPEYFMASAYLVDNYDYSPLCTAYETPMYTQEMQELLASTVDDYDADKVLNLDEDTTTNFAVYADDTILIEEQEGVNTVASVDDETATYVIENADESITSLQVGEIFAYPYGENEILIVKVATITVDGTTATITGAELEMEEAFSHVKIESAGNTEDLVVDETTGDEGITYTGAIAEEEIPTKAEGNASVKFSLGFDIEKEFESVKLKGSLSLQAKTDFSFYVTMTRQFIEFTTDVSTAFSVEVSGKATLPVIELPSMGFSPVPGVYIGFEPQLVLEFSAKVKGSIKSGFTKGFSYENKAGFNDLSTAPKVEFSFEVEGTIFFGLDLAPHISVLDGCAARITLSAMVGIELKAEMTGTLYDDVNIIGTTEQPDSIHTCESCLKFELYFKTEITIKLELLKFVKVPFKITGTKCKIGVGYYSIDQSEFGWGSCPNKSYRVSVYVQDAEKQAAQGVDVIAGWQQQSTEIPMGTTNGNGIAVDYLYAGTYTFTATVGEEKLSKAVTIYDACKVVLDNTTVNTGPVFDCGIVDSEAITDYGTATANGTCGDNGEVFWILYGSGTLVISGTGAMADYSDDSETPWYDYYNSVKKVEIKDGVTNVGEYAFYDCSSLSSVTIPDSVTSIGNYAFAYCDSLTSVTIGNSVTSIGNSAFTWCEDLTSVTIPDSVTSIGDNAFAGCDGLTSVTLGNSVTNIGSYALYSCDSLTSITIPDSVTSMGKYAFSYCANLTSVTIGNSVTKIEEFVFCDCTSLTSVTIGNSVTRIRRGAFEVCTSLTSVTIPDSVTSIGPSAFSYCDSLTSITIPDSVISIGSYAFENCDSLTFVTIGNGVTSIDSYAFESCDSLTSVTIGNSVTSIDSSAFESCDSLTSVTIPDSVTSIGSYAFESCTSLSSATIGNSVTSIGSYAFNGCSSLTSVMIPDGVTSIGSSAFESCDSLTSVTIGNSVTSIGSRAFSGDTSLVDVKLSESLTTLGSYAFNGCSSLETIELPETLTTINSYAFQNCSSLTGIDYPESLNYIGMFAFNGCSGIDEITLPSNIATIQQNAFAGTRITTITVPKSVTTLFSRTASYEDYYSAFRGATNLTEVIFEDGSTSIPAYALRGCSQVTAVVIPNSVTSISEYAFCGCTSLAEIIIPNSVTSIGTYSFENCTGISNITIPSSVQTIGTYAFNGCTGLSSVTFNEDNAINVLQYNDHYYAVFNVAKSWDAAKQACEAYGGHLATVTDAEEQVFITGMVNKSGKVCWLGASDTEEEGSWKWTTGEEFTYSNWKSGEPNNSSGSENYLGVYLSNNSYKWNDFAVDSTTVGGFICEWDNTAVMIRFTPNIMTDEDEHVNTLKIIGNYAFSGCTGLTKVVFNGTAPTFGDSVLSNVTAAIYYPAGNATWTEDVMQDYGGTITWVPYTLGEDGQIVPAETATVAVASEEAVSLMAAQTEETEAAETETTTTSSKPATKSVWGGEYTTETTDTYILKTASFSGLVAGEEYVLLSMVSIEAEEILAPDNLLFIDQAAAAEDGTLVFQYVQRETTDTSYVVACGPSDQDLSDAVITFPEMTADGELHVVAPTVVYDGTTLTEGVDYTIVGRADYTDAGTYTCYIHGIRDYTGLVECTYTVAGDIELFNLAGMTMSLGNSLAANFVVLNSNLDGDGYYAVITKEYANSDPVTVTIPMDQWQAYGTAGKYFTYTGVTAKEMTDVITVDVYNVEDVQVMNTYTRTIEDYCYQQLVKEEALASPNAENLALYTDILKYGAAAQNYFDGYNADNLATARLSEAQLAYGTQEVTMTDIRVKGDGYMGSTLSLKSEISMNFVFANATIGNAAYATISFTDHYGNLKETTVLSADFVAYGTAGKYIIVDGMGVADCFAQITVTLYAEDGTVLSTNVDSVESYIARMSGADEVYPAILKLATSAYNYFH